MGTENALVPAEPRGMAALTTPPVRIESQSLDLMTLANTLARSGYFKDATDASKAVVKILYGQELGIPPISSMMGVHIIEGKPAPSANLLAAVVKRSGRYDYRVLTHTEQLCEIEWYQGREVLGRSTWSMQDAVKANLSSKQNWKQYPRQMLFSRAISEGARTYCPEVFGGAPVYTPDELGATVNADGDVITVDAQTGEVKDERPRGRTQVAVQGNEQGSFAGNAVAATLDSIPALRQACAELLAKSGFPEPSRPREYFEQLLNRAIPRLAELTLDDWRSIHEQLSRLGGLSRRAFKLWAEICKHPRSDVRDARDRELRLQSWGECIGETLETCGTLIPEQWDVLNVRLHDILTGLDAMPEPQSQAEDDEAPTAAEAQGQLYSSGLADPFQDE